MRKTTVALMDGMDYLMENLRLLNPLLAYAIIGSGALVISSRWTWMGLVFITFFRLWRFRGIKGFHFRFPWWENHAKVRVMLQSLFSSSASTHTAERTNITSFNDDNLRIDSNMCMDDFHNIEKTSSLPVAKSVPSPLRFAEKKFESSTSDHQRDCLPRNIIRLPKHEKFCPADEFWGSECRSIEEPMQECGGEIAFFSDFTYGGGWKENCKGNSFITNDGEGGGSQLGPRFSDNRVELGMWQRLKSFEMQSGWDMLQSLRLGYHWHWNRNIGTSGLNFDKFSKYSVRDFNVAEILGSPKRNLVKLFSLQKDCASSIDMVSNTSLSYTGTIDNTVRLWDIEVGKFLNKMTVDNDYAIVGSDIKNSPGFLLSGVMIRDEKASLFVWDPRDFLKPLNFSLGNMLTFHSAQFTDNKVCLSDCFSERQFDLRMIAGSSPIGVFPTKLSCFMKLHGH